MKQLSISTLFAAGLTLITAQTAIAKDIKVVSSIAPVHSLVSMVMGEQGENHLLVSGSSSPHGYYLRPSEMKKIVSSDLVFWIGPNIESFLSKPLNGQMKSVELNETKGLTLHNIREGGIWAGHDHGSHERHDDHRDHDHAKHDDHDHEKHDDHKGHDHEKHDDHKHHDHKDHDHEKHDDHKGHDHAKHDDHDHHGASDAHVWLDPENAIKMVKAISSKLSETYPDKKAQFEANAEKAIERIEATDRKVAGLLEGVKSKPYIVFHDAFQYFEKHYGLTGVGSILLRPDEGASAKRVAELRDVIEDRGAVCIFREPQFPEKLVKVVSKGSEVRSGTLDPVGSTINPDADLYEMLIVKIATEMNTCLQ
ncbi:zinc ABC transporter solute-binding protein [Sneathiella sp. P13V-1]|uniref:zinc ABC transporter substrate-binding protein n=1 Tax=Sneathiella sp. P13V-1 TaxID=2697366 RepID=UPI00187B956E|nr:zinc ABC transporter substrate-binding protein [Sneathiella sp. P13V-1]MBE7637365.1 zinc ABC transporter solute-binding protein [Sneathiella sp. P13V-1]